MIPFFDQLNVLCNRRKNWKHSKVNVTVEMSTVQESAVSVLEESATLPLTPTNSVHVTEIDNEQSTAYAKSKWCA